MSVYVDIRYPCRVESQANKREHWAPKWRRNKALRHGAHTRLMAAHGGHLWGLDFERIEVTLTRIAPRRLDKDDNLNAAMKAVRDGVADWAQLDDGSDRYVWTYKQERGEPREYAVRIEVRAE